MLLGCKLPVTAIIESPLNQKDYLFLKFSSQNLTLEVKVENKK